MNELVIMNRNELAPIVGLEELADRWESFIDVNERSKTTYRNAVKQFIIYVKELAPENMDRQTIIDWRESLKEKLKPTTVQTYITAIKLFFRWLEQEGIYKNIADHIKGAKISGGHKKDYLTSLQSKKVLAGINTDDLKGLRDYAIIALMLTTGMRTIEVTRANIEDLRTVGDYPVLFIQGKGRDEKSEYVKIAPPVETAIRSYLKARGEVKEGTALFTSTSNNNKAGRLTTRSIRGLVKTCLISAGYNSDRLTSHSLRHTAGTLALLNGATTREVQQLLRHSNINTTMIYAHELNRAKNDSELKVANAIF